ncbi:hypothetical protein [Streptomyces sp. NPDC095613]|uniref:hypothetical protein n=1 Tax=Streptomyces sp. NPDC095613 TaxID=3155540 RepID=UPI00332B7D0E
MAVFTAFTAASAGTAVAIPAEGPASAVHSVKAPVTVTVKAKDKKYNFASVYTLRGQSDWGRIYNGKKVVLDCVRKVKGSTYYGVDGQSPAYVSEDDVVKVPGMPTNACSARQGFTGTTKRDGLRTNIRNGDGFLWGQVEPGRTVFLECWDPTFYKLVDQGGDKYIQFNRLDNVPDRLPRCD